MIRLCIRGFAVMAWSAMTSVGMARAQETINYASVSGRVMDPQGAVAQVSARQTDTNVTAETITDDGSASRT